MYTFMLLAVLCGYDGSCHEYVVDSNLSFSDCKAAVAEFPAKADLYELTCKREDEQ